jgi:hypothetical protein
LADLTFVIIAATFKKIAMAMAIAKNETHMALPPYPIRSTAISSTLSLGNLV